MSTLLPESQRHQLLIEWNNTASDYPHDQCVQQLFEAQVTRTPNATAVVFEDESLTYQQLNQKANQLAHYLKKLGVGAEVLVGIHVERSLEMIIGLLGILKAGGAYVPLDPAYPQERLMFMLADAHVTVLLTQSLFAERIQQLIPEYSKQKLNIVYLDGDWEIIDQAAKDNLVTETRPENLAYVIYTSGSTGKPKGVLLEHRGLCNLSTAQNQIFDVKKEDKILQFASLNFDASIWEIIMALIPGATLCLGTRDTFLSGNSLFKFLNGQGITIVTLPPSVLAALPFKALPSLRMIIVAGENCSIKLATQWSSVCYFFNAYGPTETTVCATVFKYTQEAQQLPIGYPIANTQVYILDEHQQLVPIGTPGELYIGGAGLARGYLNRPKLTAEKFIPNPFSDDPQARLYKTGDLVRYLPNGNIEFLGRVDNQVKIRGFRIELEEIEAVLNQDSTVKEAVVLAQEDNTGNKQLIAYIVSKLIPDRLPIQSLCTVKFEGFRPIALKTEDISCNGVCVAHVPLFCKPNQQVQLQLQLADIPDKSWLTGKVAWCRGQRAGIALFADSKGQEPLCQTVEYLLEKQGFLKTLQRSCTLHLREYLKEKLPEYMIPANFIMLMALPLTPNGKIDRQALLTSRRNTAYLAENLEAPQTPTEEILVNIWTEVLKREYISVHDNFLELGGHSLLATQIISQLRSMFQIELPLYRLFELATIKKIAEYIEASYQEEAEEVALLTPPI
ncbi:MAG: non-ribosomal peptide synthetase, partial [Pseudomonadota bacterium]|nr:non-ribosomal peptide synthetase [Pseudomonadota bacterium]